jgi:hypothetical protein
MSQSRVNLRKNFAQNCDFYFFLRVLTKNRLLRRPRIDYNKAYFNGAFCEGGRTLLPAFLPELPPFRANDDAARAVQRSLFFPFYAKRRR